MTFSNGKFSHNAGDKTACFKSTEIFGLYLVLITVVPGYIARLRLHQVIIGDLSRKRKTNGVALRSAQDLTRKLTGFCSFRISRTH
ncbi:MAG TPA: hypothetical protein DF409_10620 [Bacteroidales bacterium]|nr:hypothetical protein [Bacteroidales bacterium]